MLLQFYSIKILNITIILVKVFRLPALFDIYTHLVQFHSLASISTAHNIVYLHKTWTCPKKKREHPSFHRILDLSVYIFACAVVTTITCPIILAFAVSTILHRWSPLDAMSVGLLSKSKRKPDMSASHALPYSFISIRAAPCAEHDFDKSGRIPL